MSVTDLLPAEIDGQRSAVALAELRPDPALHTGPLSSAGEHHQGSVEAGESPAAAPSAVLPQPTTSPSARLADPPSQDRDPEDFADDDIVVPDEPTEPTFKLRKLDRLAYWMSITAGAAGQIMFLGQIFGGSIAAYVFAALIASFAEAIMSAGGDWALEHMKEGRAHYQLLMVFSLSVSVYAGGVNVSHFWAQNRSMAVMFGAASMLGFLLHLTNGYIRVKAYLKDKAARKDALLLRHQRRVQRRHEEMARQHELQALAVKAEAEARGRHAAELDAADRRRKAEQERIEQEFELTEEIVRQYVTQNNYPTAAEVWDHFEAKYGESRLPHKRSVQRWVQRALESRNIARPK